jgi:transcriptional regulator with XRE-family HTH domain
MTDVTNQSGFADLHVDAREVAYARLLRNLRSLVADEAARENVSMRELARRLNVAPSVVSRVLSGEKDLLTSTLFDFAWELGREWEFSLHAKEEGEPESHGRNFHEPVKWVSPASVSPSPGAGSPNWKLKANPGAVKPR